MHDDADSRHGAHLRQCAAQRRASSRLQSIVVLTCIYAIWVGALVGTLLKLTSPHRNAASWLFAGLVGGLGGVGGLYFSRMFGLTERQWVACFLGVALCAAALVMLWALVSRGVLRSQQRRNALRKRATRPTIVF
jgi:predicted permease